MDNIWGNKHVTLYGPHPGANQISIKSDGFNTTVPLEAGGTSDINTLRFQYSTDGGVTWVNIGGVLTSRNDDGAFAMEWNPQADSGIALGTVLDVRANGHSTLDGLDHPGSGVPVTFTNTQDTIGIAAGSQLGVWHSNVNTDNVILSGRASYNGTGTIGIGDPTTGTRFGVVSMPIASNAWKTVYDIKPVYANPPYGYNTPNQVVMSATTANVNPTSSDTEAYTLYDQVLTDMPFSHPTPVNDTTPVPVTITVRDQNHQPVAGVNVSEKRDGFPVAFVGTTDANGQVTVNQRVVDGNVEYVANGATGSQLLYDPTLGDIHDFLQLESAHAADLVANSTDGAAFDFDENANGDVSVQVKDQNNANFDTTTPGQNLTYHWKSTPFDGEPEVGASHTITTDVNGKFDIPALTGADFPHGLKSGTFELFASLTDGGTGHPIAEKKVLTVKAGEAAVRYDDPDGDGKVISPVGSTAHVHAHLVLEDGTGLPGRKVDVNMVLGQEQNEDGPTGTPDAVITSNDPATTDSSGSFTVDVEDLSTDPTETEVGGFVQAFSANTPGIGDWVGDANQIPAPNTEGPEPYNEGVDFVTDQAPAGSVLDVNVSNTAGPAGNAASGSIHLEDSFGDPLAGVQVQLTLDHGYFINLNHLFVDPVAGAYVPEFDSSLGTHLTVSTNSSGNAQFFTSIGRDSGFDDDGKVDAKVTGTVTGANSANDTTTWSSDHPYNVSEISVQKTPDADQTIPTDPAPTGVDGVLYDVFAKDQFGNPSRGVEVDLECAVSDDADCPTVNNPTTHDGFPSGVFPTSDLDNGGDLSLEGVEAGTFHLTAKVVGGLSPDFFGNTEDTTEVWDSDGQIVFLTVFGANPVEKEITTTFTQEFYDVDVTHGSYTISADPGTTDVPTDTPVTVTVNALDQEGNPLAGMRVDFVRTSDADNDQTFFTDGSGEAQYVFQGTNRQCGGQDTVTAVVRDASDTIVKQLNITIHFAKCQVDAALSGHSSKDGKKDILNVSATTDDGASALTGTPVTLQAKVNGHWTNVGVGGDVLNSNGKAKITVRDANGGHVTKYRALIGEHGHNASAVSNVARVR